MKKNRRIGLLIRVLLIIFVLEGMIYAYCTNQERNSTSGITTEILVDGQKSEEDDNRNENTENSAKVKEIKDTLKTSLPAADEYLILNNSDLDTDEFIEWFAKQYGDEIILKLDADSSDEIEQRMYEYTGKSLIVNLDEFMKIKNYDTVTCHEDGAHISFAGDICLAEDGFVLDYYDTVTNLSECISSSIIQQTNEADLFMINNEFSISDRGAPLEGKYYTFRAMPQRTQILKELGADIVSLANNHVFDFGEEAFLDTIENIQNADIKYVGGGKNRKEAEKVIYFESNGIKIGFISASRAEKYRFTPGAEENSPGIFLMYDPETFLQVAADAAKKCDYLIAYVHWGTEDSKYYEEYQHDLAVTMFDSGIDAIIGGHPHVLQGIEYINGKPVVYSLGDFWFNDETKYTALLNLVIDYDGLKKMSITPCLQSNFTTSFIENEEEAAAFMQYIRELSSGCNVKDDGEIYR